MSHAQDLLTAYHLPEERLSTLEDLLGRAEALELADGQALCSQGEPSAELWVLLEGEIAVGGERWPAGSVYVPAAEGVEDILFEGARELGVRVQGVVVVAPERQHATSSLRSPCARSA